MKKVKSALFRHIKLAVSLSVALTLILMMGSGCSSDSIDIEEEQKEEEQEEKREIAITLTNINFVETRSSETKTADDLISIYMFDSSGKFEQRYDFKGSDAVAGKNRGEKYTFELPEDASGRKEFAVIRTPGGVTRLELNESETAVELANKLTPILEGALTRTFVMSNKQVDGKFSFSVEKIEETKELSIELKRRIARIDLVMATNDIQVTKIKVINASTQSYIGDIDNVPSPQTTISYDFTASNKTFYLYPTVISQTGTQIEVTVMLKNIGYERVLTLKEDIEVKANHYYQLMVENDGTIAIIDQGEWKDYPEDENTDIEVGIKVVGATLKAKNSVDLTGCQYPVTITITSKNSKPNLMPSGNQIGDWLKKEYEVMSAKTGVIITSYTILDANDDFAYAFINTEFGMLKIFHDNSYEYPGSGTIGYLDGNIVWAPVAIGQPEVGVWTASEKSAWNNKFVDWNTPCATINVWPTDTDCPTGWRLPTIVELSTISTWEMRWDWSNGMVNFPLKANSSDAIMTAMYKSGVANIFTNEFCYVSAYYPAGVDINEKYPAIYRHKGFPGQSTDPGPASSKGWTPYNKPRSAMVRCVKDVL